MGNCQLVCKYTSPPFPVIHKDYTATYFVMPEIDPIIGKYLVDKIVCLSFQDFIPSLYRQYAETSLLTT